MRKKDFNDFIVNFCERKIVKNPYTIKIYITDEEQWYKWQELDCYETLKKAMQMLEFYMFILPKERFRIYTPNCKIVTEKSYVGGKAL